MSRAGASVGVAHDTGILRDVLVHRPVARSSSTGLVNQDLDARRQHDNLVEHLRQAGITVRRLEELLTSALEFADARDWILERRIGERDADRRGIDEIAGWLSEQPAAVLSQYLTDGLSVADLPKMALRRHDGGNNAQGWFLPPLDGLIHPQRTLRFLDGGALISHPPPGGSRAEAINMSALLNFAPVFDEARFEFWISSDGADLSCPPIHAGDVLVLSGETYVLAITRRTSAQALSLLAAALFRQNLAEHIYWIDLTAAGQCSLDDCLLPLSQDCLLVDTRILDRAQAVEVRPKTPGPMLDIETCAAGLLAKLLSSQSRPMRVIDVAAHSGAVGRALAKLAPIVVGPGRLMLFEDHSPAFATLEAAGLEIVAALPGSALMREGKGPRDLVTALLAEPASA